MQQYIQIGGSRVRYALLHCLPTYTTLDIKSAIMFNTMDVLEAVIDTAPSTATD